jgi:RNA polymerase sigma-70 factor, ECF subfamily
VYDPANVRDSPHGAPCYGIPVPQDPNDLLRRSISPDELPDPGRSLALLARAQGGDRAALEDLIGRYQERLRRIVRIQLGASALRRHYDSMDIVQNTFRAALPKIGDIQPRTAAGLLQWLSIIALNQIRDAHDLHHAEKRDIAREERLDDERAPISSSGARPDEEALLAEVRELLDDEVAKLPDEQRRVVVLRDYCGEDWDRIAAELDRENGATRQLHQRAWIKLRQALRPRLEGNR